MNWKLVLYDSMTGGKTEIQRFSNYKDSQDYVKKNYKDKKCSKGRYFLILYTNFGKWNKLWSIRIDKK